MSSKIISSPEAIDQHQKWKVLGTSENRWDGVLKVTGSARFTDDIMFPNALYARLLRSPHAHARITSIDTSKAEALPGVKAVVTYNDIAELGIRQSVPAIILFDRVFYVGDLVAAVAAEDEGIADEALDLIEVEYETLPVIMTPEESMKEDAYALWPEISPNNAITPWVRDRGDVAAGFAEADVIVEAEFRKPNIKHMFSENFTAVAKWEGDDLHLWVASQGSPGGSMARAGIAGYFGMPQNKITLYQLYLGGGFGGKLGTGVNRIAVITGMLAKKAGRPVKLRTNICEHFVFGHVLDPGITTYKYKLGAKADGTLTAIDASLWTAQGRESMGIGVSYVADAVFNTFIIPNRSFKGYPYFSNGLESGALRAYGSQAGVQPLAGIMSEMAEKLGMDPTEFQEKNGLVSGEMCTQYLYNDFRLSGGDLPGLIQKVKAEFGWSDLWKGWGVPTAVNGPKRRGVGAAAATHAAWAAPAVTSPRDTALVKLNQDGTVELATGQREMGSGLETAACQCVAEVLGIGVKDVRYVEPQSMIHPNAFCTCASRGLMATVWAAYDAAEDLRRKLLEAASKVLAVTPEELELDLKNFRVYVKAAPETSAKISDLASLYGDVNFGIGYAASYLIGPEAVIDPETGKPWGMRGIFMSFAEVEVDTETGKVEIVKLFVAPEAGMVLNPGIVYGQTIGGLVHGWSQMLGEGYIYDEPTGTPLTTSLVYYPFLTALDVSEEQMATIVVENPALATLTPYKAKGLAEGIYAACWGSIGEAIYNAIGVRVREWPFSPEKILKALGKAQFPVTKGVA